MSRRKSLTLKNERKMNYAIIAAGEGSRLAQEGVAKPKPLVDICGEPMIGRLINLFCRCNAESISIIVNEQMTEVREYIESLSLDIPLNLVVKTTPELDAQLFRAFKGDPERTLLPDNGRHYLPRTGFPSIYRGDGGG